MKNILKILGGIALVAVIGFSIIACDDGDDNGDDNITVEWINLSQSGSETVTTAQLNFVFSEQITGLSANDINISGVSGVVKGNLRSASNNYHLPISGFTEGGTLNVSVTKAGYNITGSPKQVTVYYVSGSGDSGGTFALSGIPSEYNGKYAFIETYNLDSDNYPTLIFRGFQSFNTSNLRFNLVQITDGNVILPLWVEGVSAFSRYTGSQTIDRVAFIIYESSTLSFTSPPASNINEVYFDNVAFSDGNATRTWSQRVTE